MENDEYIKIDLSQVEPGFIKLTPGRHKARIVGCVPEFKEYMKRNPENKSSGKALTWTFETFGNEDMSQNNKKVFQSTPLDGRWAKITRTVIQAALPDCQENEFRPQDVLGKEVEIELQYNRDAATGQDRAYPNVKAVYPLIGRVPDLSSIPNYSEDIPF